MSQLHVDNVCVTKAVKLGRVESVNCIGGNNDKSEKRQAINVKVTDRDTAINVCSDVAI